MPLRRADRLFDILRVLRAASRPVTAASLADELEVTVRTVYRDIATLQARTTLPADLAPPLRNRWFADSPLEGDRFGTVGPSRVRIGPLSPKGMP